MKRIDFYKTEENPLGYILYLPESFDKNAELPLIVFLHGAGERGDGNADLEKVNVHGISRIASSGEREIPAIVLCPQCPCDTVWNKQTLELKGIIDKVVEEYCVNKNKISISGLSMGGFGTWEMALTYPSFFSCFAPVCGGGMAWRCDALKGKDIWAFHGDKDCVVDISNSIEMVNKARSFGANVKFTIFSGVGHDSWIPAYEDTRVIDWLINHSL